MGKQEIILSKEWVLLHEPHGLLTFEETSSNLMGFLCLSCEEVALTSLLAFQLIPGALDLYIGLLKKEETMLISRLLKKSAGVA